MNTVTADTALAHEYFSTQNRFTVSPAQLMERLGLNEQLSLVDVRERASYLTGRLPGAINLPECEWASPAGLSHERINILYCHAAVCHLAAHAAERFSALGYPVAVLAGGFATWTEIGMPVSREGKAAERAGLK